MAVSADETGCVVTDVRMPDMSGFELLAKMKDRRLALPVIVITANADVPLAIQAMKQGAVDLLEKPFEEDALLDSIRHALTPNNSEQARAAEIAMILARRATLTGRESEVLAGLLEGQPNKAIAHELRIRVQTVEIHRANVMAKMGAASLSALLRMSLLVRAGGGRD